jgi:hypothetical protein
VPNGESGCLANAPCDLLIAQNEGTRFPKILSASLTRGWSPMHSWGSHWSNRRSDRSIPGGIVERWIACSTVEVDG